MDRRRHGYLGSEAGAVAPIVAISLVGLIGMGGLAYDVSRGLALRSELESAVDAAALAGATQLDGSAGARSNAAAVASGVLARNPQILADLAEANVVVDPSRDIVFLSSVQPAIVANNAAQARFIQINLTPRRLGLLFGAFARVTNFNVTAHAIAGLGTALCKSPPIVICNPLEGLGQSFSGDANIGRGLVLQPANGQAWGPGVYGVVDSPSLKDASGAPLRTGDASIFDAIARVDPQIDCIGDSITVEPASFPVSDAMNVRFDIYAGQATALNTLAIYQPSLDSITGLVNTTGQFSICNPGPPPQSKPWLADSCASGASQTCNPGLGDGTWDSANYLKDVHNGDPGVNWANFGPTSPTGASPTRYQVYQWELQSLASNNQVWSGNQASTALDNADFAPPRCNTAATQQAPDRRVISVSVVDCQSQGIVGRTVHVPVIARVDLFLTEPVDPNTNDLYAEVLGTTSATSPGGQATRLTTVRLYG